MVKEIDFTAEIDALFRMGKVNLYMAKYLLGLHKAGLNEELWDEAIDDAAVATDIGVSNEEEFLIFFYIDHFVEELVDEIFGTKLDDEEENDLKRYMFSLRDDVDYGNLLTFRVAVLKWLKKNKKLDKKSHTNIGKPYQALPKYNNNKWEALVEEIKIALRLGYNEKKAVSQAANQLKGTEKYDFLAWYKFYRTGQNQKYDVNDEIRRKDRALRRRAMENKYASITSKGNYLIPMNVKKKEEDKPVRIDKFDPAYYEQKARDFDAARNKLVSRTMSIDKLLEKYRKVLDPTQLDAVEDALNSLRKKIRKLKMAQTVKDSMIKTAGVLQRNSFDEGSKQLIALADEVDVPDAPSRPVESDEEAARKVKMARVVDKLEEIVAKLKNRETIRLIAEVDLLMHELKISSYFSELTDAQAKLIEAYGYASNKVEDVLPKIRGALFDPQLQRAVEEKGGGGGALETQLTEMLGEKIPDTAELITDQEDTRQIQKQKQKQRQAPKPDIKVQEEEPEPIEAPIVR